MCALTQDCSDSGGSNYVCRKMLSTKRLHYVQYIITSYKTNYTQWSPTDAFRVSISGLMGSLGFNCAQSNKHFKDFVASFNITVCSNGKVLILKFLLQLFRDHVEMTRV